jgi:hypothetical protein
VIDVRPVLDDFGKEADDVADRHRLPEEEGIHRHRGHTAKCPVHRGNRSRHVCLRHDPTAKDVTLRVDFGGHRHDPQGRLPAGQDVLTMSAMLTPQVIERSAGERRKAGTENHSGVGQVGVDNDPVIDQLLRAPEQRFDQTFGQTRRH